jgi:hypothetical protein
MEFLRPLIMPVILVLLFTILWVMGSMKQMDAQIRHCQKPTLRSQYIAQSTPDDLD